MQVKNAMVTRENLVTSKPQDTIRVAMNKMVQHDVGSVIIQKPKNHAVGIITAQDIMQELLQNGEVGFETIVEKIMSKDLITINEDEPINLAIETLQEANTHHLIVINDEGELTGILSSLDIVRERSFDIKAFPWIRK